MKPSTVFACKKWSTVLGSFLILFPLGITWYWGNVSVYVLSYIRTQLPPSSDVDAPWVMSLIVVGYCIGMISSAVISRFLGKRVTCIVGITAFSIGWVGGYFAVQKSYIAMNIVIGLTLPIGADVAMGSTLLYAVEWCRDDMGTVMAIIQSGYTAGAICINQFVTFYLNPKNMLPDGRDGPSKFFSQDEIIDKVPSLFLIIACITLSVNVIGLLLMKEVPKTTNINDNTSGKIEYTNRKARPKVESPSHQDEQSSVRVAVQQTEPPKPMDLNFETDFSPKQVVRTSTLYLYWFLFVTAEVPYIILCNYYKAFAQVYIEDDHFLTNVSSVLLIVITLSRTVWGLMLDRLGLKATFIVFYSGCATTILLFYFSLQIHKWCYVVFTLVFGCFGSPLFILFSYSAVKSFGKRYLLYNFGLVMLPTLLTNLAIPPLFEYFLVNLGWFYVFGFCSFCNLIGLVVVIIIMPERERIV